MEAREARNGGFDEDVFILDYDVDNEAALLILLIQDRRQQTASTTSFGSDVSLHYAALPD